MLDPVPSARFKKNYQTMIKRGYNMSLIDDVIDTLLKEIPLPPERLDHALSGNWKGYRECHITPAWLLIYRIDGQKLLLYLTRTGSHSDLFE